MQNIILITCTYCGEHKERSAYFNRKDGKKGYHGRCKACFIQQGYEWNERHPQRRKAIRRKSLYSMTEIEFRAMQYKQQGLCAICRKEEPKGLRIDHDHITGRVRALLCDACNKGIGHFFDQAAVLRAAARYIDAHSEVSDVLDRDSAGA